MTAGDSAGGYRIDGRFELLERLGGGGMGLVWRARDTLLHREVALKEVRSPDPGLHGSDPAEAHVVRERVLREAQALARLHHANVVTIYHIVDSPELAHPWLVMELVSGGSLEGRLNQGTLTFVEAVRIGRGVLSALRAAHAAGIQHRDVKPANVLLRSDGTPVLTDFGIAALQESPGLTATGMLIGSPEYMAPERIHGREGDPASDLWSLGLLLYVGLEGYNPLRRDTTIATIAAVSEGIVPPALRSGPLTPVLGALLVREPGRRPNAEQLDWMLAEVERGLGGLGMPAGPMAGAALNQSALNQSAHQWPSTARFEPSRTGDNQLSRSGTGTQPVVNPYDDTTGVAKTKPRVVPYVVSGITAVAMSGSLVWVIHKAATQNIRRATTQISMSAQRAPGAVGGDGSTSDSAATGGQPAPPAGTSATFGGLGYLTPAGVRDVIARVKKASGGTKIVSMVVYPDHASLDVVKPTDPGVFDSYDVRAGKIDVSKGTTLNGNNPIDPSTVNWDVLPALFKDADANLGVKNPTTRYFSIDPNGFGGGPEIDVYVADDYRDGHLAATFKGAILRRYPSK